MNKNIVRYTVAILITVIVLFPIVWLISTSFKRSVDIFASPPVFVAEQPTSEHYTILFTDMGFFQYIRNSIIVAGSTTLLALGVGTLASYSLARFHLPANLNLHISFWVLSTRMFPPIVTIIPLFTLMRTLGLVNTRVGLVLAYAAFNLPFVVWMMRSFFAEIPKDLDDAAMVDGYSRMQAFWHVILPIARPGVAATAIFTLILSWNEFLFALVLSQTRVSATLPIGVASRVTQYQILWGQMSASGVIAMAPVLIFAFFVQRHLVRGMSFGAIK